MQNNITTNDYLTRDCISLANYENAQIAIPCGHHFSRSSAIEWFGKKCDQKKRCPLCNKKVKHYKRDPQFQELVDNILKTNQATPQENMGTQVQTQVIHVAEVKEAVIEIEEKPLSQEETRILFLSKEEEVLPIPLYQQKHEYTFDKIDYDLWMMKKNIENPHFMLSKEFEIRRKELNDKLENLRNNTRSGLDLIRDLTDLRNELDTLQKDIMSDWEITKSEFRY